MGTISSPRERMKLIPACVTFAIIATFHPRAHGLNTIVSPGGTALLAKANASERSMTAVLAENEALKGKNEALEEKIALIREVLESSTPSSVLAVRSGDDDYCSAFRKEICIMPNNGCKWVELLHGDHECMTDVDSDRDEYANQPLNTGGSQGGSGCLEALEEMCAGCIQEAIENGNQTLIHDSANLLTQISENGGEGLTPQDCAELMSYFSQPEGNLLSSHSTTNSLLAVARRVPRRCLIWKLKKSGLTAGLVRERMSRRNKEGPV